MKLLSKMKLEDSRNPESKKKKKRIEHAEQLRSLSARPLIRKSWRYHKSALEYESLEQL